MKNNNWFYGKRCPTYVLKEFGIDGDKIKDYVEYCKDGGPMAFDFTQCSEDLIQEFDAAFTREFRKVFRNPCADIPDGVNPNDSFRKGEKK